MPAANKSFKPFEVVGIAIELHCKSQLQSFVDGILPALVFTLKFIFLLNISFWLREGAYPNNLKSGTLCATLPIPPRH